MVCMLSGSAYHVTWLT